MPLFDLTLPKLKTYKAPDVKPRGFDSFWRKTLAETAKHDLSPEYDRVSDPIHKLVDVYDVSFSGFGGHRIKGWFIEPAGNKRKLPCIITYIGYGGGRSLPIDHVAPATAGFANLVMDTRGQGTSPGAPGDTPDPVGGVYAPGAALSLQARPWLELFGGALVGAQLQSDDPGVLEII